MKLPPEPLNAIACHLTETSDLLSLGLTCKYLATVIFRYNLFYHTISAHVSRSNIWIYFIINPQIARYVRRLQILMDEAPSSKMQLPFDIDVGVNHSYQEPENASPLLWAYELLAKALRHMVNLKAFEWLHFQTPIFDVNSDFTQAFSNQRILEQVGWVEGRFVSLFDTPILCSNNLISLTITTAQDNFDSGKSIISFLTTCHRLRHLNLSTYNQALIGDLISLCRWPKLKVLDLYIYGDSSVPPTEECIRDFIAYHSSIVSLRWYVSLASRNRLPLPILHFNSLPHLRAVKGSAADIWPAILSPCTPPRPLEKITHFPTAAEFWSRPERSFHSISRSSLRIIGISIYHISDLNEFLVLFPNVECIDLMESDAFTMESATLESETPDLVKFDFFILFDKPTLLINVSFTDNVPVFLSSLSAFMNLRVILGIRFWDYPPPGTEELRVIPMDRAYFRWVHTLLPHLEFCGVKCEDGVEFIHEGNNVQWKWVSLRPEKGYVSFAGRERDFTIREECDRFAS